MTILSSAIDCVRAAVSELCDLRSTAQAHAQEEWEAKRAARLAEIAARKAEALKRVHDAQSGIHQPQSGKRVNEVAAPK